MPIVVEKKNQSSQVNAFWILPHSNIEDNGLTPDSFFSQIEEHSNKYSIGSIYPDWPRSNIDITRDTESANEDWERFFLLDKNVNIFSGHLMFFFIGEIGENFTNGFLESFYKRIQSGKSNPRKQRMTRIGIFSLPSIPEEDRAELHRYASSLFLSLKSFDLAIFLDGRFINNIQLIFKIILNLVSYQVPVSGTSSIKGVIDFGNHLTALNGFEIYEKGVKWLIPAEFGLDWNLDIYHQINRFIKHPPFLADLSIDEDSLNGISSWSKLYIWLLIGEYDDYLRRAKGGKSIVEMCFIKKYLSKRLNTHQDLIYILPRIKKETCREFKSYLLGYGLPFKKLQLLLKIPDIELDLRRKNYLREVYSLSQRSFGKEIIKVPEGTY